MRDNKLLRINKLNDEKDELEAEESNNIAEIERLTLRNKEIKHEKLKKKQAATNLSRERYSDKKLRRVLYELADQSDSIPETAITVKDYISSDKKDLPEDVLDAFVKIDNYRRERGINITKMDVISNAVQQFSDYISDLFLKVDDEEEDADNDN